MKPLAIGHPQPARNSKRAGLRAAFTLVELVVVMAIMVVVIGVVAPAFKSFTQGRNLANEAQRFLSMTRYGMARAVGEGVPVDLRMNVAQGWYGMAATGGYTETKTNETWYSLDKDVQMQVFRSSGVLTRSNSWTVVAGRRAFLPAIRFDPDGFIGDSSPSRIVFSQGPLNKIWLVQNATHTRYEVQINPPRNARF